MRNLWLIEESGIKTDILANEKDENVVAELDDGLMVMYINDGLSMREYKQIQTYTDLAKEMDDVRGVAMILNSPGGLVNGLNETCKEIQSVGKPVYAFTETMAASAAYAIAASADKIYSSPSADVGSVGARIMHVDFSKMLDDAGIKITEVGFGKKKTQFSPFHSLSQKDKEDLGEYVKEAYDGFVGLVKARRAGIADEVFESGLYTGSKAEKLGLTNGMISTESRFIKFMKKTLATNRKTTKITAMENNSMTTQTEIDRANEHIEKLESSQGGILAWLKNRFGEKPTSSHGVKAGDYEDDDDDKKKDDDDEDDDDKKEMKAEIENLGKALAATNERLTSIESKVSVLADRLGGDASPTANVSGAVGSTAEQLRHHQEIQKGLSTWQERQEYGQEHIAPLQKKLGRLN